MKTIKMKWNDLIELIMSKNKGIASLNYLYEQAANYRKMPSGDWQKTLRGVLYREVHRGRFKKSVWVFMHYQVTKMKRLRIIMPQKIDRSVNI